jgi:hypothetical protein
MPLQAGCTVQPALALILSVAMPSGNATGKDLSDSVKPLAAIAASRYEPQGEVAGVSVRSSPASQAAPTERLREKSPCGVSRPGRRPGPWSRPPARQSHSVGKRAVARPGPSLQCDYSPIPGRSKFAPDGEDNTLVSRQPATAGRAQVIVQGRGPEATLYLGQHLTARGPIVLPGAGTTSPPAPSASMAVPGLAPTANTGRGGPLSSS